MKCQNRHTSRFLDLAIQRATGVCAGIAIVAGLTALLPKTHAATYTWDFDNTTAGNQDGGGNGSTIVTLWSTSAGNAYWDPAGGNGTSDDTVWTGTTADTAVFGSGTATSGTFTVTASGTLAVGTVQFNAPGGTAKYLVTGGTISGDNVTLNADIGVNGTVNSAINTTSGLVIAGTGTITLGGLNNISGGITVNNGATLAFDKVPDPISQDYDPQLGGSGKNTLEVDGTLNFSGAAGVNTGGNGDLLSGANFVVTGLSGASTGKITVGGSNLIAEIAAGASFTYSGTITGPTTSSGAYIKQGLGTQIFNNTASSGPISVYSSPPGQNNNDDPRTASYNALDFEIDAGTVEFDYTGRSTADTTFVKSPIIMRGGTMLINGGGVNNNSASFSSSLVAFLPGESQIAVQNNGAGPNTVTLKTVASLAADNGGTVDFQVSAPNGGALPTITTSLLNTLFPGQAAGTIIGGSVTFNKGSSFAAVSSGNIIALPDSSYISTSSTSVTDVAAANSDLDVATNVAAGANNSVTGAVSVNSLRFNGGGASTLTLDSASVLTVQSGGILITPNVNTNNVTITGGALATSTTLFLAKGLNGVSSSYQSIESTNQLVLNQWNTAGALILGSTLTNNVSTFSNRQNGSTANISVNTSLVKSGPGLVDLTADNQTIGTLTPYTGITYLDSGVLLLDNASGTALGTGNLVISGGILGLGTPGNTTFNRKIGSGVGQIQFQNNGGFAAINGPATVALTVGSTTNGTIAFATGTGTDNGSIGAAAALVFGATDLPAGYSLNTLTFTNPIDLQAGIRTIRVDGPSTTIEAKLTGVISSSKHNGAVGAVDGLTIGGLIKEGSGYLQLTATSTYAGPTTITGGTLELDNNGAAHGSINASSLITVNGAGARFLNNSTAAVTAPVTITRGTIGGTGTISAAGGISIGANAVISPGNSPAAQQYTTGVTFASAGTYKWEVNNANGTAGTNYDQLQITSGLKVAGPFTIDITGLDAADAIGAVPNFHNGQNYAFLIATTDGITGYSSGDFILDTTDFAADNPLGGGTFAIHLGTDSVPGVTLDNIANDLYLTFAAAASPVPEPASIMMLGLGAAALLTRRKRRN